MEVLERAGGNRERPDVAGTWYLVADQAGRPRLFRVGRFRGIAVTTEPVRRRDGAELVEVWEELGRKVESRAGGGAPSGPGCAGTAWTCPAGSPARTSSGGRGGPGGCGGTDDR
ncbi:WYL domain-containing protein [Streptomyces hirsutus]|uniref:WYL domain-containing protein n=1 Tax=Streptomyces hirsutus TaxID=35620 RepID=UPI000AC02675|nr:WYL domain-containing protein [Streptomyces hirsutus]